ncbi:MAG: hypothetical protein NTW11_03485 [Candidatus Staskawiczbacteria bacterium]|nr:hypothetical protein [Candidatus Staskawiczbacteria bacterium]
MAEQKERSSQEEELQKEFNFGEVPSDFLQRNIDNMKNTSYSPTNNEAPMTPWQERFVKAAENELQRRKDQESSAAA